MFQPIKAPTDKQCLGRGSIQGHSSSSSSMLGFVCQMAKAEKLLLMRTSGQFSAWWSSLYITMPTFLYSLAMQPPPGDIEKKNIYNIKRSSNCLQLDSDCVLRLTMRTAKPSVCLSVLINLTSQMESFLKYPLYLLQLPVKKLKSSQKKHLQW